MRTLARFGLVGASGATLNIAAFWLLSAALGLPAVLAAACAFELALASNFALNHRWTFATRASFWPTAFARYQVTALGGLVLQLLTLHALTAMGLPPVLANAVGIEAAMGWNLTTSLRWTWPVNAQPCAAAA
ncbi:MAG TPA: GtrA family protein [Roseiflexaceae bacterium]